MRLKVEAQMGVISSNSIIPTEEVVKELEGILTSNIERSEALGLKLIQVCILFCSNFQLKLNTTLAKLRFAFRNHLEQKQSVESIVVMLLGINKFPFKVVQEAKKYIKNG